MSDARMCPFSAICIQSMCDLSCPKNAMSDLMFSKSRIDKMSKVYQVNQLNKRKCADLIASTPAGGIKCIESVNNYDKDTNLVADTLVFVGICDNCLQHGSSISVYHLKFSTYIQDLRDSWSNGLSSSLKDIQSIILNCKLLIISGLDYIQFKDYECQILLNLLDNRTRIDQKTVIVVHSIESLSGTGTFFNAMKFRLKGST